jgi:hypothetical protein
MSVARYNDLIVVLWLSLDLRSIIKTVVNFGQSCT